MCVRERRARVSEAVQGASIRGVIERARDKKRELSTRAHEHTQAHDEHAHTPGTHGLNIFCAHGRENEEKEKVRAPSRV